MDRAQVGIKIDRRNINNLSYADDITLMAEIEMVKAVVQEKTREDLSLGIRCE